MSELATKAKPIPQPVPTSANALMPTLEASAIISMIERASRDDTVNIDKMRELLAMRKEIIAQQAEQNFNEAMARTQSEMRAVATDANNPQTRSKYASYFALDKVVRPIYTKHGFALSFDTEPSAQPNHTLIVCYVTCAGHTRKYRIDMPADGKGAKGGDVMTLTHAAGSAMTYGQRYLLKAIFNMAIGGDDDGNGAGRNAAKISDEQVSELLVLIADVAGEKAEHLKGRVLRYFNKIETLADLPVSEFANCTTAIEGQRKNYV